jgi:hypothetical protein
MLQAESSCDLRRVIRFSSFAFFAPHHEGGEPACVVDARRAWMKVFDGNTSRVVTSR